MNASPCSTWYTIVRTTASGNNFSLRKETEFFFFFFNKIDFRANFLTCLSWAGTGFPSCTQTRSTGCHFLWSPPSVWSRSCDLVSSATAKFWFLSVQFYLCKIKGGFLPWLLVNSSPRPRKSIFSSSWDFKASIRSNFLDRCKSHKRLQQYCNSIFFQNSYLLMATFSPVSTLWPRTTEP